MVPDRRGNRDDGIRSSYEAQDQKFQAKMTFPRGEIYLDRFDPAVGHQIQKTRPDCIRYLRDFE
jgi:hypothetical protein